MWREGTCSIQGRWRPREAAWVLNRRGREETVTALPRGNIKTHIPQGLHSLRFQTREPAACSCLLRSRPRAGIRAAGLGSVLPGPGVGPPELLGAVWSGGRTANGHEEPRGRARGTSRQSKSENKHTPPWRDTQNSAPTVSGKKLILRTPCPCWPLLLSLRQPPRGGVGGAGAP